MEKNPYQGIIAKNNYPEKNGGCTTTACEGGKGLRIFGTFTIQNYHIFGPIPPLYYIINL